MDHALSTNPSAEASPSPIRPAGVLLGHVIAVIPDVLFADGLAHEQWMDLFLAHISSHDVPGGLWTLYTTFLVALAAYLISIANNHTAPDLWTASRRQTGMKAPRGRNPTPGVPPVPHHDPLARRPFTRSSDRGVGVLTMPDTAARLRH